MRSEIIKFDIETAAPGEPNPVRAGLSPQKSWFVLLIRKFGLV